MEDKVMTIEEANRLRLLKNHADKMITLREVSNLLGISYRQVKRLWKAFRLEGETSVISKKRGNNNRSLGFKIENRILSLIKRNFVDYGPTLASEKLDELYEIKISREKIRKMMILNNLWTAKKKKTVKTYQRRTRRSCFGELIQIDGSPHAWLEDRGPYCTLLLAIDDSTSAIMAARFELSEAANGYFLLMKNYLNTHGKPVALYTDKYSVFRVNKGQNRNQATQFSRSMKELDIKMIVAHSPQAKGRVERTNSTLQDRLVKELRRQGISTIEEANVFLLHYIEDYNKRFKKSPASTFNAHTVLDHTKDLNKILCSKEIRVISKNLEVSYNNQIYQINAPKRVNILRGAKVYVIEKMNGEIFIEYQEEQLKFKLYKEIEAQPKELDYKNLQTEYEQSKRLYKPKKYHPWR